MINGKRECFQYVGKRQPQDSQSICKKIGGKVPLPKNTQENNDLVNGFRSLSNDIKFAILGLWDTSSEGKFLKFNGEKLTYTNWDTGEPNDFGNGEDYVVMYVQHGLWNDVSKNWLA